MKHFIKRVIGRVCRIVGLRRSSEERVSSPQEDPRTAAIKAIHRQSDSGGPVKMVIGAAYDVYPGWISTTYPHFDVTNGRDWSDYFSKGGIDALLAEHVVEHLTKEQFQAALNFAHPYMRPGTRWRIAVPDGYFPSEEYIDNVKPGGVGPGCDDHKLLYQVDLMREIVEPTGFSCTFIEWWDKEGVFHKEEWSSDDGMIKRSAEHDARNSGGELKYTSLIVDLFHPECGGMLHGE